MNHYTTSYGERLSQSQIDRKIRLAKAKKLQIFLDQNGFIYCENCKKSSGAIIDCSHIKSVYDCKKDGEIEKAWDIDNIQLLCRKCHQEHDKLNIHNLKIN